jgi:hypothetical protein
MCEEGFFDAAALVFVIVRGDTADELVHSDQSTVVAQLCVRVAGSVDLSRRRLIGQAHRDGL